MGLARGIQSLDQLEGRIVEAVMEPWQAQGLPEPGHATENVVQVIDELLR